MAALYLGLMGLAAVMFVIGVLRDRRKYSNGIWLGLALVFFLLWLMVRASRVEWLGRVLGIGVLLIVLLIALVLPVALIINGVLMLRREGHRPANLLSLLAGLGMLALHIGFWLSARLGLSWPPVLLGAVTVIAMYLAFLFVSLLLYSIIYSRMVRRRRFDAVIVLGAGLIGDRVPPLLAGRLDQAIRIHRAAQRPPVLVVSGGQGSDEQLSEAEAMAGYLRERGIPETDVVLEPEARTTEENLRFSTAILRERDPAPSRIAAVTNNYHVFRTALLSRRLRLRLDVLGSPTALYFLPSAFLREFVAMLMQNRVINGVICALLGGGVLALGLLV